MHLNISSPGGWFPTLFTEGCTFDGAPKQYPHDVLTFPSGNFAEDGIVKYAFTEQAAMRTKTEIASDSAMPGMLSILIETFDSAATWYGTQAGIVTGLDPVQPENRVVLLHEDGDASYFKDVEWPSLGRVMTFDYLFREPRGNESLTVYVDGEVAFYDDASTSLATDGLTSSGALYVGNMAGTTARLTFLFRTDGVPDGEVVIDSLRIWAVGGDSDGDADVDADDFGAFQNCFSGPAGGIGAGCEVFDFDEGYDIDCDDWVLFVEAWTEGGDPPYFETCDASIPAVSEWGLVAMTLLVLTAGTLVWMRRRAAMA